MGAPPELKPKPGQVMRLRKTVSGKGNAPMVWYFSFRKYGVDYGMTVHSQDRCVFLFYLVYEGVKVLIGHLLLHVDDFSAAGTTSWCRCVSISAC